MPSANPKLEKQASTEATDPIRQVITTIEHKIRNLEKRKGKLESYRDLQKAGKELNTDQKTAVAKYDEVQQTLEITRDLQKQIQSIFNDATKQQKKLARKEAAERTQQEINKVKEVLVIQETLVNMGTDNAREDFLNGTNGAAQLTKEDLDSLDTLYNETTLKRQSDGAEATLQQQVQKVAEHFVAIIDGKQREVFGTTYGKIKEIIAVINKSGYFDRAPETDAVEEVTEAIAETQIVDAPVQEPMAEEFNSSERHIPPHESVIPLPNFPVTVAAHPVVPGAAPVTGPIPVVAQPMPTAPVDGYYRSAPGFVPPPQQQQQQQQQTQPPPPQQTPRINDMIGTPNFFFLQESELDSPDVAAQTPIVSHIPTTVNASAIPSQTYTNQTYTGAPPSVAQPVIYQPQPQDMTHIPAFTNPNPPPPIPMPPSHQQQPNMQQFNPQHQVNYQQQMPQSYDPTLQQQDSSQSQVLDGKDDQKDVAIATEGELEQASSSMEWNQNVDGTSNEWQGDMSQQSGQQQQSQQWGERSNFRSRGGKRGGSSSNGYNGRPPRATGGGYQQNGRGNTNQGSYFRNDNSNYQNGYSQRSSSSNNWSASNNEGGQTGGYVSGYNKRGGPNRGPPRATDRPGGGMDRSGPRDGQRQGGQFRVGQRGAGGGNRSNNGSSTFAPRSKPQAQQQ